MAVRKNNAAVVGVAKAAETQTAGDGAVTERCYCFVRTMPSRSADDIRLPDETCLSRCKRDAGRALSTIKAALGIDGVEQWEGPYVMHNGLEVFAGTALAAIGTEDEVQGRMSEIRSAVRTAAMLLKENGYRVRVMAPKPQQQILPHTDAAPAPAVTGGSDDVADQAQQEGATA